MWDKQTIRVILANNSISLAIDRMGGGGEMDNAAYSLQGFY